MRLSQAFKRRRSALNFKEDFSMNEIDFETIFELARYSPSVYNTQVARYVVTTDKQKQQKLKELNYGQHKLVTASGVIVVLADKNFLSNENVDKVYGPMVQLGMLAETDYAQLLGQISQFRNNMDEDSLTKEIYRNTFISVGFLLSIIAVLGFDSCPMHANNPEAIKKLFDIPDNLEVMFLITVGKSVDKERPRGYRHQLGELVKFETYGK